MTNLISEVKEKYEKFNEEITERRLSVTALTKMLLEDISKLISAVETAERQRDEAVKALEWYGDKEVYTVNVHDQWQPVTQIDMDLGDLARTTLKRIKGENG